MNETSKIQIPLMDRNPKQPTATDAPPGMSMTKRHVLGLLRAHKPTLVQRFRITALALFGSFARDQASGESDIDILVRFDGPTTSRNYFGAQFYLEDLIGRQVDLVTDKALRPELRPHVEREAIHV